MVIGRLTAVFLDHLTKNGDGFTRASAISPQIGWTVRISATCNPRPRGRKDSPDIGSSASDFTSFSRTFTITVYIREANVRSLPAAHAVICIAHIERCWSNDNAMAFHLLTVAMVSQFIIGQPCVACCPLVYRWCVRASTDKKSFMLSYPHVEELSAF